MKKLFFTILFLSLGLFTLSKASDLKIELKDLSKTKDYKYKYTKEKKDNIWKSVLISIEITREIKNLHEFIIGSIIASNTSKDFDIIVNRRNEIIKNKIKELLKFQSETGQLASSEYQSILDLKRPQAMTSGNFNSIMDGTNIAIKHTLEEYEDFFIRYLNEKNKVQKLLKHTQWLYIRAFLAHSELNLRYNSTLYDVNYFSLILAKPKFVTKWQYDYLKNNKFMKVKYVNCNYKLYEMIYINCKKIEL